MLKQCIYSEGVSLLEEFIFGKLSRGQVRKIKINYFFYKIEEVFVVVVVAGTVKKESSFCLFLFCF